MKRTALKAKRPARVSATLSDALFERAEGRCERCGDLLALFDWCDGWTPVAAFSRQHREARGSGGTTTPDRLPNLALLCGSATSGCHNQVENVNRERGYKNGWAVKHALQRAEDVPVLHWQRGLIFLAAAGYSTTPPNDQGGSND